MAPPLFGPFAGSEGRGGLVAGTEGCGPLLYWGGGEWAGDEGGCLAGASREVPRPHVLFAFAAGWGVWRRGPLLPLHRAEGGRGGGPLALQAVLWRGRLGPCRRGLSGLVRAPLSAAPLPPHGGGWKETAVSAAGFSAGFPGDFCAPFEGAFHSAAGGRCRWRLGGGRLAQLPAGGVDGGLPMEKGAAVCYND